MTDEKLRKRCEAFLGSQVVVPVYGYSHKSGNLGEFGQRELRPPELNGETAMALLEMCVQKGIALIIETELDLIQWHNPYGDDSLWADNWRSLTPVNHRNLCEACVLALEGKSD